jgi:hypothetical protein
MLPIPHLPIHIDLPNMLRDEISLSLLAVIKLAACP